MITYKFKQEKRQELLRNRKIMVVAQEIGIAEKYLNRIITNWTNCKTKVYAFAIAKHTNPKYEIKDVFDIEE